MIFFAQADLLTHNTDAPAPNPTSNPEPVKICIAQLTLQSVKDDGLNKAITLTYMEGDYQGNKNIRNQACVKWLGANGGALNIGGPGILIQNEIASQAFEVLGKKQKITYIPL